MRFSTKAITTCAVLAALALALSYLESFFPPLLPLPGVKLGLANIVTVYALILIQHSGQIHPCVVFIQNGMKRFKTLQCCFVRGNAHSVKTGLQSFSVHSRMLSHINFTQLSPSRRWFLMKYSGLEGLPLPVAVMPTSLQSASARATW